MSAIFWLLTCYLTAFQVWNEPRVPGRNPIRGGAASPRCPFWVPARHSDSPVSPGCERGPSRHALTTRSAQPDDRLLVKATAFPSTDTVGCVLGPASAAGQAIT